MGCGYSATGDYSSGFFRIQNNGQLQYYYEILPAASKSSVCYGIASDEVNRLIYVYLLTTSNIISSGSYTDAAILVFDQSGNMK